MEWYDNLNPIDEPEYECAHCEKPLYKNKGYCSNSCFNADML